MKNSPSNHGVPTAQGSIHPVNDPTPSLYTASPTPFLPHEVGDRAYPQNTRRCRSLLEWSTTCLFRVLQEVQHLLGPIGIA